MTWVDTIPFFVQWLCKYPHPTVLHTLAGGLYEDDGVMGVITVSLDDEDGSPRIGDHLNRLKKIHIDSGLRVGRFRYRPVPFP